MSTASGPADKLGVSLIICTFNRADALSRLLQSVAAEDVAGLDLELLVVDNNCTDATPDIVAAAAQERPYVRLVREPRQGLSHARNTGADAACHDFLLYLDDDAVLTPGYLQRLTRVLREIAPDLYGGPVLPLFEAPPPDWFDPALEIRRHADGSGISATATISGPNFGIRRSVMQRIGPFATDLGMVGGEMAFGEDREMVERYRTLTPPGEQKLYYGLELCVEHEAPARKLTRAYQLSRGYRTAVSRERVFIRTGVRSPLRSQVLALGHVALAAPIMLGIWAGGGFSARSGFMAHRHGYVTAGRVAGAFSGAEPALRRNVSR